VRAERVHGTLQLPAMGVPRGESGQCAWVSQQKLSHALLSSAAPFGLLRYVLPSL
jgi:hypothetical protein